MVRRRRLQKVSRRWKEHYIMLYDGIAVVKRIYIATRAQRIQNSKRWILSMNKGLQQPHSQRPDFLLKRKRMQTIARRVLARTDYRTIHRSQQVRLRKGHPFEGNAEYDYVVDPKTGWRFYKQSPGKMQTNSPGSKANLQTASSSSSKWDQTPLEDEQLEISALFKP